MAARPEPAAPVAAADVCWALTRETVAEWVGSARPGEELVYAGGTHLIRSPGVEAITRAAQEGKVRLNFRRSDGKGGEYLATRRANGQSASPPPVDRNTVVVDDDLDEALMLFGVLCKLASRGRPCPTNRELGEMLGGIQPERISYLMSKNISAGRVRSEALPRGRRVVTIVASGLATGRGE